MRLRSLLVPSLILTFVSFAPAARAGTLDMSALWPNTDGLHWTYAERTDQFGVVPTVDRVVRFGFEGGSAAPGGIPVQVLHGELISGPAYSSAKAREIPDPFLRALATARPDLASRIAAFAAQESTTDCPVYRADGFDGLLLGADHAWRETADEIAAWRCNAVATRAWMFLVSDLSLGHTFDLQLVPDIATDIFLHGRMAAIEDVTVPGGTFPGCLRVEYVIDYGLGACTDQNGTPVGTYRSETRGWVDYAPGVGPVRSSEDFIPYVEASPACLPVIGIGQPASRVTMQLTAAPVPVNRATWGRLKAIYR